MIHKLNTIDSIKTPVQCLSSVEAFCLDANTTITYESRGLTNRKQPRKTGTIERLYQLFHRQAGDGKGRYQFAPAGTTYWSSSMDDNGNLWLNRVTGVVDAGIKECFRVKTRVGKEIVCSIDLRFASGARRLSASCSKNGRHMTNASRQR
jgi:hypothetical protein